MSTYNLTARSDSYPFSQLTNVGGPVVVRSNRFSGASAAVVKGSAVATADVFQLLNVPAGAFVLSVTHKVATAEGGTCTYDIGDGAGTAGYCVAATSGAGNSTSTYASSFNGTTTPTFGVGKFYSAADTIDLILSTGTAAVVVIDVTVTYVMTQPPTA